MCDDVKKLKKAKDLYLRGFCNEYIKRRTGISIQQLLKILSIDGITYTKSDIVEYQISYIRQKYTTREIVQAFQKIQNDRSDFYKKSRKKHVECLGCGFGQFDIVFYTLLGNDLYKSLCIKSIENM